MYLVVFNNFIYLNKYFIWSNDYMCQYNIKKVVNPQYIYI